LCLLFPRTQLALYLARQRALLSMKPDYINPGRGDQDDESCDAQDEPLLDYLHHSNRMLAGHAEVIIRAADRFGAQPSTNDFRHSQCMYDRLSRIVQPAKARKFTDFEVFTLIAAAYLHDIRKGACPKDVDHGWVSADFVENAKELDHLFPGAALRGLTAEVCRTHTSFEQRVPQLQAVCQLDLRPRAGSDNSPDRESQRVRPRLLAALLCLADTLDCSAERTMWDESPEPDLRNEVHAVSLETTNRVITLSFKGSTSDTDRDSAIRFLQTQLGKLNPYLKEHSLDFTLASPASVPQHEEVDSTRCSKSRGPAGATASDSLPNIPFDDLLQFLQELSRLRCAEVTDLLSSIALER